jgi:inosine-uridine nucleoside N-ribohydrolase
VWRHVLRFNTEFDPDATEIVVRSGIPFTFVPDTVTRHVFLRLEDLDRIEAVGTPYHRFLGYTSRPWVQWYMDIRKQPGAMMHDPLTLAVVIDPTFCMFVPMRCDLERFRRWEYPYLYASGDSPQVRVAADVDAPRFEEFLVDRLATPLARHPSLARL